MEKEPSWCARLGEVSKLPESGGWSQGGEQGIVDEILKRVGTTNRQAVDIGAGDGRNLSNTRFLRERGWSVLMLDGRDPPSEGVVQARVTAENINELLRSNGVSKEFDFLSLDIDGVDYWIWKALEFRPRVICVEFNGVLPAEPPVSIPYDADFRHDGTAYYGANLGAYKKLGTERGYTLVHQQNAVNLFFVRDDALAQSLVGEIAFTPEQYHPPDERGRHWVEV